MHLNNQAGIVVWITGLSGSGKTTLGNAIKEKLIKKKITCVWLDGDQLREIFHQTNQFDRSSRLKLGKIYGELCKVLSSQGISVVISTISLFKEVHQWNRDNIARYYEIFIDIPLTELQSRDPKGIYKLYRKGKIKGIPG
jgi:Adenylylsulfate kinase and related kinases